MGPQLDPVQSDTVLPRKAAVVVIGGGIIGTSATLALAQKGVDVVLCEKGEIGGEQSSRNWGWVRKQGRDPAELPVMIEALSIWDGLTAEAEADLGFRRTGILYAAKRPEDIARIVALVLDLPNTASVAEVPINCNYEESY